LQQSFGLLLVIHHGLQSKQRGHRWGSGMGRYSQHRALPFRHGQRGYAAMCLHAQRGLAGSVWPTFARRLRGAIQMLARYLQPSRVAALSGRAR
jgi:hypothetical protein